MRRFHLCIEGHSRFRAGSLDDPDQHSWRLYRTTAARRIRPRACVGRSASPLRIPTASGRHSRASAIREMARGAPHAPPTHSSCLTANRNHSRTHDPAVTHIKSKRGSEFIYFIQLGWDGDDRSGDELWFDIISGDRRNLERARGPTGLRRLHRRLGLLGNLDRDRWAGVARRLPSGNVIGCILRQRSSILIL